MLSSPTRITSPRSITRLAWSSLPRLVHFHHEDHSDELNSRWGNPCTETCIQFWLNSYHHRHTKLTNLATFLLRNELWEMAYWRTCRALGHYIPKGEIPPNLLAQLHPLRNSCLNMTFDWGGTGTLHLTPAFIPPTKLPEFQDRVVQEVLLFLLEPAFESRFSRRSFAFRPGRSALSALRYVTGCFQECEWFLTGDLTSVVKRFDVGRAMRMFREVVEDEVVEKLVREGLTVETRETVIPEGYYNTRMKKHLPEILSQDVHRLSMQKKRPFWLKCFLQLGPVESRTLPRWGSCQLLSPMMLNLYLHQLDLFMEEKISEFTSMESGKSQMMEYVRYAGHYLIGIKGTDEAAVETEEKVMEFCRDKLGLSVVSEIFHVSQRVPFLAHWITSSFEEEDYPDKVPKEKTKRELKQKIKLVGDMSHCVENLVKLELLHAPANQRMKILPCYRLRKARQEDCNLQMSDLLHLLSGYYRLAVNRKKLTVFLAFVLRSSLAVLYAGKYRLRTRAGTYKHAGEDLSWKIKGKKGVFEYAHTRGKPMPEEIVGIPFRHSFQVPPPVFLPLTQRWNPLHENCLNTHVDWEKPGETLRGVLRYREADCELQKFLVDTVWRTDCAKPVVDILLQCNDT